MHSAVGSAFRQVGHHRPPSLYHGRATNENYWQLTMEERGSHAGTAPPQVPLPIGGIVDATNRQCMTTRLFVPSTAYKNIQQGRLNLCAFVFGDILVLVTGRYYLPGL